MKEAGVVKEKEINHYYHHPIKEGDNQNYRCELSITSSIFSITLGSDNEDENIDFLTEKALYILKEVGKNERKIFY